MASAEETKSLPLAIFLVVVSYMMLSLYSLIVKILVQEMPVSQIIFANSLIGYLILQVISLFSSGKFSHYIPQKHRLLYLVRIVPILGSMYAGAYILNYLSLGEEKAIGYVTPIIFSIIGWLYLKETVPALRWLALFLGLVGVSIVAKPTFEVFSLPLIIYLISRLGVAIGDIALRLLRQKGESPQDIIGAILLGGIIISPCFISSEWGVPSVNNCCGLVVIAIFLVAVHCFCGYALGILGATMFAPFSYTTLFWAILFDFIFFGILPDIYGVIGTLLVVADAGFAVVSIYLERRKVRSLPHLSPLKSVV